MAVVCRYCNSHDTQAGLNTWLCLNCGKHMSMQSVNEEQQRILEANEPSPE